VEGWDSIERRTALACLLLLGLITACVDHPAVPPLPTEPSHWVARAEGSTWSGPVPGRMEARFEAVEAELVWRDGAPHGTFHDVRLQLWTEAGASLGRVAADRGEGSWPEGPLELTGVRWELESPAATGSLPTLTWEPGGRWSCDGCDLERLVSQETSP
jgi:hypothetical protein